jgi:hypothetical protein
MKTRRGWWFCGSTLRDGWPIPADGEWLRHHGLLLPCRAGLHASPSAYDALGYAPGDVLCEVECEEPVVEHGDPPDKWVSGARKIVRRINAKHVLRAFARWCALRVVPDGASEVVVRYLRTGDQLIRATAQAIAWTVAFYATDTTPRRAAAWAAMRDSTDDPAWTNDIAVGRNVAAYAVRAAAENTRDAAWNAERAAQRVQLAGMVEEAFAGKTKWVFDDNGLEVQP